MITAGALLPHIRFQARDGDGNPLAGAKLQFHLAGTSTPALVYTTPVLPPAGEAVAHENPVVADAGGFFAPIYLLPTGYKVTLLTADDVVVGSPIDGVYDIGQLLRYALSQAPGAKAVVDGYAILDTDHVVTVDGSGGDDPAVIELPPAADRQFPIIIKNLGTTAVAITPDGTDEIDGVAGPFAMPAAAGTVQPAVTLQSDGSMDWYVTASHGLVEDT